MRDFLEPRDGRSLVHMDLTAANIMYQPETLKVLLGASKSREPKGFRRDLVQIILHFQYLYVICYSKSIVLLFITIIIVIVIMQFFHFFPFMMPRQLIDFSQVEYCETVALVRGPPAPGRCAASDFSSEKLVLRCSQAVLEGPQVARCYRK